MKTSLLRMAKPVLYAAYISVHRWGLRQGPFFGLANYERALGDGEVWNAFVVTIYYVIGTIPLALGLAFLVAYLLFQRIALLDLYRTAFFLPYVTSTVAAAMVFGWLFHSQYGVVNYLLGLVGVEPQKWLLESTPTLRLLLEAAGMRTALPDEVRKRTFLGAAQRDDEQAVNVRHALQVANHRSPIHR